MALHVVCRLFVLLLLATWIYCADSVLADDALPKSDVPTIQVDKFPKFTELHEWIQAIQRPGFSLLVAERTNGYFVAVFKTGKGNLALCQYNFDRKLAASLSMTISDASGGSVIEKDALDRIDRALVRKYHISNERAEATLRVIDGYVYPIIEMPPRKIQVKFAASGSSDTIDSGPQKEKVFFDRVIDWR